MGKEQNIIYYGKEEGLPKKTILKAGKLDLFYENGFIRYINLGDFEIIRMINHAVRDHNWGTVPIRIYDEEIKSLKNSFSIKYKAEAQQNDIHFLWNCTISGDETNTVNFRIEGKALTAFKKNRIGFTVLHPVKECQGKKVNIKNPEGITKVQEFPKLISPNQPFFDIQSMEWETGNTKALLEFSGDVFETEDQRNWTDASYKTYCTPLGLPFPVMMEKGDTIHQSIILKVKDITETKSSESNELKFDIGKSPFSLPKINIGQSSEVSKLSTFETEIIKAVNFDHYQADIRLYEENRNDQLKRAISESKQLDLPLELSLFFDDTEKELECLTGFKEFKESSVSMISVFNKKPHVTTTETIEKTFPVLRKLFPEAAIGVGTNAFFAELNRTRISAVEPDYLVYSINPQVHAFDNDSLIETIDAQPYTVRTAKEFSNGKPIHISPVTFKMRWNPNATGETITIPSKFPDDVDVRQMSLFGASWVLGSINSLLGSGPASVTFFETVGIKGIMQSTTPLFPDQFHAQADTVYPLYFIFKIIMEHKNLVFYPIKTSDPLKFTGLAFGRKGNQISSLLLANYSGDTLIIKRPVEINNYKMTSINDESINRIIKHPKGIVNLNKSKLEKTIKISPFGMVLISQNN